MNDTADRNDSGKEHLSLEEIRKLSLELTGSLDRFDRNQVSGECRVALEETLSGAGNLIRGIESFIAGVVMDLDQSGKELKKSSKMILGRVRDQLDKVTESTQTAVTSVLDRIDHICDRQNDIFERIVELREKLSSDVRQSETGELMEIIERIESIESEIQGEAFEIMNAMQFQDITSQQIQLAQQLLEEAREKLLEFRRVLSAFAGSVGEESDGRKRTHWIFDPGATLKDREQRQRLADEVGLEFEKSKDS